MISTSATSIETSAAIHAGVDVSKHRLSLCLQGPKGEKRFDLPNDARGIKTACQRLKAASLVVLEPTSVYHRPLIHALKEHKIAFALPNPRRTSDFARALHGQAKSDPLDARGLALFGQVMQPEPRQDFTTSKEQEELSELFRHRLDLVEARTALHNRLKDSALPITRRHLADQIDLLHEQIAGAEREMERRIEADEKLKARRELLKTAPGLGPITILALLCLLPELGHIGGKQIAALVGLAPFVKESGQWKGRSMISGGRKDVRCALHMATLSAIRTNQTIHDFYKRLRAEGKPAKLALTAASHKLLLQLNAMLQKGEPSNAPRRKATPKKNENT